MPIDQSALFTWALKESLRENQIHDAFRSLMEHLDEGEREYHEAIARHGDGNAHLNLFEINEAREALRKASAAVAEAFKDEDYLTADAEEAAYEGYEDDDEE